MEEDTSDGQKDPREHRYRAVTSEEIQEALSIFTFRRGIADYRLYPRVRAGMLACLEKGWVRLYYSDMYESYQWTTTPAGEQYILENVYGRSSSTWKEPRITHRAPKAEAD